MPLRAQHRLSRCGRAGYGAVRRGGPRHGSAWYGKDPQARAGPGKGVVGRGGARPGTGGRGRAWSGTARRGITPDDNTGRKSTPMITPTAIGPVGNDGLAAVSTEMPYAVEFSITGYAAMLFHRWSVEAVAEKAKAAKNSQAKKEDDVESYVWRADDGTLALPGEYVRQSIIGAAKFRQDPRSPRKSAQDLYKAAVVPLTELASLGVTDWDYLDQRRVMVQRNGVTRTRPALRVGWQATFVFQVQLPEYVQPTDFYDVLAMAGRVIGVGDFRPTYGRFQVTGFATLTEVA